MPISRVAFARTFALTFALAALTACGEESGPTEPPPTWPLAEGVWYMHTANDLALPDVEIARRFIGLTDEQTLLDSSRITVYAGGAWEQRYWTRVFHVGVLDRSDVVIDEGTWSANGAVNTFVSTLRPRVFTGTVNTATQVTTDEPMVFFIGAVNVEGVYRTTPPTP